MRTRCMLGAGALAALALASAGSVAAEARSIRDPAGASAFWTPARIDAAIASSAGAAAFADPLAVASVAGPAPTHLPGMRAVGAVFSVTSSGAPMACSGTLVDSANGSVVWTAGHCVHDGAKGGWRSQIVFAPGYQPRATGNPMPFGLWPAAEVRTTRGWERHGMAGKGAALWRNARFDAAAFAVQRDAQGRRLVDALGVSQHIRFGVRKSLSLRFLGYPVAAPYDGEHAMMCGPSRSRRSHRWWLRGLRWIPCRLSDGMSGGPALSNMDANGVGTVIGMATANNERSWRMYFPVMKKLRRLYALVAKHPI